MAKVSVSTLEKWGRERLSKSFFLRDFLFSDIAAAHGFCNFPDDLDLAIKAGKALCENLLEPLQDSFGRIAIRSAYRSAEVNGFGNEKGLGCASNEANAAGHIWDSLDNNGHVGATACIVVPSFWDRFQQPADWKRLAWWIHDHLPYSEMEFFKSYWAFNLTWNEVPVRRITSWMESPRLLTKPGMENNTSNHELNWKGLVEACRK
ncbi:hypothetical protein [Novosphingobium sp. CECT 9465]|uniref:hypothetical protein n=1 Tax=Novosphingobium sp. CECT 9465 TaxID=2829794 RepID=UPI001E540FB5|nr:hypothetical protein [Novosphingobium sp. CECT 9465]CAH0496945.1 hypothetical protein NVSP9465_01994 [Novosphingobium sp. CECT 9465]